MKFLRAKGVVSLFGILAITAAAVVYTVVSRNQPLLGLDLQGGVSVVLKPVGEDVTDDALQQSISIIRNRVDAIGVAEPDISRQGDTILVQLPGVEDPDRALALVGQTAELRFRPVIAQIPTAGFDIDAMLADGRLQRVLDGEITMDGEPVPDPEAEATDPDATEDEGDTTTTTEPESEPEETTTTTEPASDSGSDEGSFGLATGEVALRAQGELAQSADEEESPSTTANSDDDESPSTTVDAGESPSTTANSESGGPVVTTVDGQPVDEVQAVEDLFGAAQPERFRGIDGFQLTEPEEDVFEDYVVLPEKDDDNNETFRYQLGPAEFTGETLEDASPFLLGVSQWAVSATLKSGVDGIDPFNELAARCFGRDVSCPTSQLAIVLDGRVVSAPQIQAASYSRDGVQITGNFDETGARDLATVLKFGSLPIELEPQQAQTVSATLGQDALDAGVIAGIIGLALVATFIIGYYRVLGVVAMLSLLISGLLLWATVAYLGESRGLALTLAGVTGLIVSIGVSVDSNIVYFEHMKEDLQTGRTLRSSVQRSFKDAFKTVVKADVASLIGAALLYFLTVGPVRGFALYLGLATILDLVVSYFFLRPVSIMLGQSERFQKNPAPLGLPPVTGLPGAT